MSVNPTEQDAAKLQRVLENHIDTDIILMKLISARVPLFIWVEWCNDININTLTRKVRRDITKQTFDYILDHSLGGRPENFKGITPLDSAVMTVQKVYKLITAK